MRVGNASSPITQRVAFGQRWCYVAFCYEALDLPIALLLLGLLVVNFKLGIHDRVEPHNH